jgi:Na+-driven multidrug efflux pump
VRACAATERTQEVEEMAEPLTPPLLTGGAESESESEVSGAERARQLRFTAMLFGSNLVSTVAGNMSTGLLGHLESDAADGKAQLAAYHIGESICDVFAVEQYLWAGTLAMIGAAYGAGDQQRVEELMHMSMLSACCSGAITWCLFFPFAGPIIRAVFVPSEEVFRYCHPYVMVHITGNYAMFVHQVLEGWLQGLQEIPSYAAIFAFRALYGAASCYVLVTRFGLGIMGAAIGSASRNCCVLLACILAYRSSAHYARLGWRRARPSRAVWCEFFGAGGYVAVLTLSANMSLIVSTYYRHQNQTKSIYARAPFLLKINTWVS